MGARGGRIWSGSKGVGGANAAALIWPAGAGTYRYFAIFDYP
jgi:hypothetical protein